MQQRPTGVTILAVLAAIGGVFGLIGALGLLAGGGLVAASGVAEASGVGGLFTIFGLISLVLSVLSLVLAYGFWMLKPWAWSLAIIVYGIDVVFTIISALQGGGLGGAILPLAIRGIILYYLFTPDVKKAFGRA